MGGPALRPLCLQRPHANQSRRSVHPHLKMVLPICFLLYHKLFKRPYPFGFFPFPFLPWIVQEIPNNPIRSGGPAGHEGRILCRISSVGNIGYFCGGSPQYLRWRNRLCAGAIPIGAAADATAGAVGVAVDAAAGTVGAAAPGMDLEIPTEAIPPGAAAGSARPTGPQIPRP